MTVIFQLFCAEDLQKLRSTQLDELRDVVIQALGLETRQTRAPAKTPQSLPLEVSTDTAPPQDSPPQILNALTRRFEEISQQLKATPTSPSQFDFNILKERHFNQRSREEMEKEGKILEWAISCEVNNFKFYNQLLRARDKAYDWYYNTTGQRPKGPDSLYSPLNPLHPLYNLFYGLSPGPNPPQGGGFSTS